MSGFVVACGRSDPQIDRRVAGWARYSPCRAVFSRAWPVLWIGALFSYPINLQVPRGYVFVARPRATSLDLVTRFTSRKRPTPLDVAAKYADHVRRRLVVKPGLTGSGGSAGHRFCPGRKRPGAY